MNNDNSFIEQIRKEFEEKWTKSKLTSDSFNEHILEKDIAGFYKHEFVQHQFNGYRARAEKDREEIERKDKVSREYYAKQNKVVGDLISKLSDKDIKIQELEKQLENSHHSNTQLHGENKKLKIRNSNQFDLIEERLEEIVKLKSLLKQAAPFAQERIKFFNLSDDHPLVKNERDFLKTTKEYLGEER